MLVPQEHFIFKLENRKKLAKILRTDSNYFKNIEANFKVTSFTKEINSKPRDLFNTDRHFKALLKRLNRLFQQLNLPDYIYGGVPKRDYLDNAYAHFKHPYVQIIDIQNFFPSTMDSYVYGLFIHKFKTSPDVAKILTLLTTHPTDKSNNRHIPQGYPTSTLLSFLAYFDLFNGINEICKRRKIHFTLFVDDMTFSSEEKIPKSFLRQVISLIQKYELTIHPGKIKRYTQNQHKEITGIIIDPKSEAIKTPNKLQKSISDNLQSIHDLKVTSIQNYITWKKLVLKLEGQVASLRRIEPNRQFPYIYRIIKDAKGTFQTPGVKGAPKSILYAEFEDFTEGEINKKVLEAD